MIISIRSISSATSTLTNGICFRHIFSRHCLHQPYRSFWTLLWATDSTKSMFLPSTVPFLFLRQEAACGPNSISCQAAHYWFHFELEYCLVVGVLPLRLHFLKKDPQNPWSYQNILILIWHFSQKRQMTTSKWTAAFSYLNIKWFLFCISLKACSFLCNLCCKCKTEVLNYYSINITPITINFTNNYISPFTKAFVNMQAKRKKFICILDIVCIFQISFNDFS